MCNHFLAANQGQTVHSVRSLTFLSRSMRVPFQINAQKSTSDFQTKNQVLDWDQERNWQLAGIYPPPAATPPQSTKHSTNLERP